MGATTDQNLIAEKKGLTLTFWRFWTIFEICLKRLENASLGHWKRLYLDLSFIGRIIVEKIDFEERVQKRVKGFLLLDIVTMVTEIWDSHGENRVLL